MLDEVLRAPDLLLAIKAEVDRDRRPGRFLLTGSAIVLVLPSVADTLVGRMEVRTLWPLSQGEIDGREDAFIDAAFAEGPMVVDAPVGRRELCERVARGGYPEILERPKPDRRRAWFQSYVTTLLQRDVRDLAAIERVARRSSSTSSRARPAGRRQRCGCFTSRSTVEGRWTSCSKTA